MNEQERGLQWGDIAALLLMVQYVETNNGSTIPQLRLYNPRTHQSVINDWLEQRQIDKVYSRRITGNYSLLEIIKRLRKFGLINSSGNFAPTDSGFALLEKPEITRDYLNWPIEIPFVDGQLDISAAIRIDL